MFEPTRLHLHQEPPTSAAEPEEWKTTSATEKKRAAKGTAKASTTGWSQKTKSNSNIDDAMLEKVRPCRSISFLARVIEVITLTCLPLMSFVRWRQWRDHFPESMRDKEVIAVCRDCQYSEYQISAAIGRLWEVSNVN